MNFSYDFVQFLNEKIMEYLPSDRIRVGDKVNFRCPLCGDSRKSASKKRGYFYLANSSYFCFNCGVSMTGPKFLQALSGKDWKDINREFAKEFAKGGFRTQAPEPDGDEDRFDLMHVRPALDPAWKSPLSDDARKYLAGRMVDRAPFLREDFFSYRGSKGDYILIPWVVCGVDAYYQLNDYARHGPTKYVFPKGLGKLVYGLDNVDLSWPYVVVFEGVYDSLFVKNGLAVGTKSLSERQEKLIRERYPNHKICLSFDNDVPGLDSTAKAVDRGGDYMFFRWYGDSEKAKDVNEAVLASGDPLMLSDPARLEKMIYAPLQTKMWLVQRGIAPGRPEARQRMKASGRGGSLITRRSLLE